MSVIKLETIEVEQTGLTKVNTFKAKKFNISTQTTAKNIRFTNARNRYGCTPWRSRMHD